MSKKAIEYLEKALKILDSKDINEYYRLTYGVSTRIPKNCKCYGEEVVKYCECELCCAHREKIPLNLSWMQARRSLDEWLENCKCDVCKLHREKGDLKCYSCTRSDELYLWALYFDGAYSGIRTQIYAAKCRLENNLKSWAARKKKQEAKEEKNSPEEPYRVETKKEFNDDEEEGFDPSILYN